MPRQVNGKYKRKLKKWVLQTYGDGESVPCFLCRKQLNFHTMTLDRIRPGALGGTYCQKNVRPACRKCNMALGKQLESVLKDLRPGGKIPTQDVEIQFPLEAQLPNWML